MHKQPPAVFKGFSLPDWINLAAGILTVIGSIGGAVLFATTEKSFTEASLVFYICLICTVFVVANLIISYRLHQDTATIRELNSQLFDQRERNKNLFRSQKEVARQFDELTASFSQYEIYAEDLRAAIDTDANFEVHFSNFSHETRRQLDSILNAVANLYSTVSGRPSAACIKIRTSGDPKTLSFHTSGSAHVATFARDTKSRVRRTYDRDSVLQVYPYGENTAFASIISSRTSDFFACDDVNSLVGYRKPQHSLSRILQRGGCSRDTCADNERRRSRRSGRVHLPG